MYKIPDTDPELQAVGGICLVHDDGESEWCACVVEHAARGGAAALRRLRDGKMFAASLYDAEKVQLIDVPIGWRQTSMAAVYLCRRIARQYRWLPKDGNLQGLALAKSSLHACRIGSMITGAPDDLFNPTYPSLGLAEWAVRTGRSESAALSLDIAICSQERSNLLVVYYRQHKAAIMDARNRELIPLKENTNLAIEVGDILESNHWFMEDRNEIIT